MMNVTSLPPPAQAPARCERLLDQGETIVKQGNPGTGITFSATQVPKTGFERVLKGRSVYAKMRVLQINGSNGKGDSDA